jgi:hypothetical protein
LTHNEKFVRKIELVLNHNVYIALVMNQGNELYSIRSKLIDFFYPDTHISRHVLTSTLQFFLLRSSPQCEVFVNRGSNDLYYLEIFVTSVFVCEPISMLRVDNSYNTTLVPHV